MADKLSKIRTGALSRGFALARVSASAGAKAAGHVLGNLFSGEETRAERLKALLLDQVTMLTRELGELKGSVMKVGQMLSMYGEQVLPPEVNAVLKSLQSQAPPLEWGAIEPTLRRALGPSMLAELEINQEALASASLGQVHRARIKSSGEEIVLKVQYPGVDKAIDSDLRALRRILSVSKLLPGRESVDELFAEVRQMLHHEVDFEREREFTDQFRELLKDDPRYVVARTYPRYSSRRVLATEYIQGIAVDGEEVRAFSQERRNAIGEAALDLYFREVFVLGTVQTDPHFGNYRIVPGPPDRLALFDFGAVRSFPERFLAPYRKMCVAAFRGDPEATAQAGIELGFLHEDDKPEDRTLFAEICFRFLEPFAAPGSTLSKEMPEGLLDASGAYHWGESDLPRRIARVGAQLAFSLRLRPPPREVIFLDRKMAGIFIFLSSLKVNLNARTKLEHYLTNSV